MGVRSLKPYTLEGRATFGINVDLSYGSVLLTAGIFLIMTGIENLVNDVCDAVIYPLALGMTIILFIHFAFGLKNKRLEIDDKGIRYLSDTGVRVQSLSQDVTRNEERCTHCGACITICPTGAFELDPITRRVNFINEKCLACELCIKACPPRAMELHF